MCLFQFYSMRYYGPRILDDAFPLDGETRFLF